MPGRTRVPPAASRGVATLTVVMVLFFIISMVAAYTSRNLIFEQRTSTNQYRTTQALEAADAGLQWAIGLLNSGRIDAVCAPTADLGQTTFRERYLNIDPASGNIAVRVRALDAGPLLPSCVFNGTDWDCTCMSDGLPVLANPAGTQTYPAFRVRFITQPARPSVVRIEVNGCTRNDNACLNFPAQALDNEGRVTVSATLALKGALTTVPVAALTAQGDVDLGGAAMTLVNAKAGTTGITLHAGGAVDPAGLVLRSTPGTPGGGSIFDNDATLAALTPERMFSNLFGAASSTYRDQPGAVVLNCAGGCTAAAVRTEALGNPGRVLWLQGNLNIDSVGDIGSVAEPVMVVVDGNVAFTAAARVYGAIYTRAANWNTSGASEVIGAVIAEGDVSGNSTATFVHDTEVLTRLRYRSGSFVMVPGSWKDFQ